MITIKRQIKSVAKFGGTSIARHMDKIIQIVTQKNNDDISRDIIVVSAPGKRNSKDIKVTDLLLKVAENQNIDNNLIEEIAIRLSSITSNPQKYILNIKNNLKNRLSKRNELNKSAFKASIAAFGEETCAKLLAKELDLEYIDPKELFLLTTKNGNYTQGIYQKEESEILIKKRLTNLKKKVIVPGFYGYDISGNIVTFSRGGSDITQAYLTAALGYDIAENFTDSPILAAVPDIVENPIVVNELTYEELRDLTLAGFNILHKDVVLPLKEKKIPVHVRETKAYPDEGTYIVTKRIPETNIVGIGYRNNLVGITISKPGLDDIKGSILKILNFFSNNNISIIILNFGIDDGTLIVDKENLCERGMVDKLNKYLLDELGEGIEVDINSNVGIVSVVGVGMKGEIGLNAQIGAVLKDNNVNIITILQTGKEHSITYAINHNSRDIAVNSLYNKFIRK